MIPLRVALENFMPYRGVTPPLDLQGLRLACLCGDNGHGKSAILDAITWALWGKSRARSDDDLVHAGQTEMQVTLDFMARDVHHRVIRRHRKPRGRARSGQSTLDLQVATDTDAYRSISGNTMRETQAAVIDLLRLEYETFVNSAFLVQGQADQFTTATPAERKQVLSEILGLSLYDKLEERARASAREAESRLRSVEVLLQDAQQELDRRDELQTSLQTEQGRLKEAEEALRASEARFATLQERQTRIALVEEQANEIRQRLVVQDATTRTALTERAAAQGRLDEHNVVLGLAEQVTKGHQQLQEARRRGQELAAQASTFVALNTRRAELQRTIDQARAELNGQLRLLESQLRQVRETASAEERLGQESTALDQGLAALAKEEQGLEADRGEAQKAATTVQVLRETNVTLRRQMEELRKKVDFLEDGTATCPLCGTELGQEDLGQVRAHYETEGKGMAQQYRDNDAQAKQDEQRGQTLQTQVQQGEARLRQERSSQEGRLAVTKRNLEQATEAAKSVDALAGEEEKLHARIENENFAPEERKALNSVLLDVAQTGYDEEEHGRLQRQTRELESFEQRFRQLGEARAAEPREQETIESASRRLVQIEEERKGILERQGALEKELEGREAFRVELLDAQGKVQQHRRAREDAASRVTRLEADLDRLTRVQEQQVERRGALRRAGDERDTYMALAQAFGKQGVQALLIETSLPEVESEANALLSRMTEGRMSLQLESQRETRQGRVQETLGVRIADEWGTRPYEMYSGGEAFRINLALRIGLSRLLARRSGAPLPVLFIDEGFGSQDARGRDRVVEAISAIQDEFDLILVITHIQELKDLFPTRIEVEKTDEGSKFNVVA